MYHPLYQQSSNPINIPVSFSYSQVHHNPNFVDRNPVLTQTPLRVNPSTINAHNVPLNPPKKSISQIVYPTYTSPQFTSSVPFHHSQINETIAHVSRPQVIHIPQNSSQIFPHKISTIRPNAPIRNFQDYRRNVSPLNTHGVQIHPPIKNLNRDKDLQKYDALRWQNKYEDLKTKYFELLTIVQNHSNIEDSWLLEEQNKLLRQKVNLLQKKDQKYYNEVTKRVQKMIEFHMQTTTQECALLIDRYRLQNKYLEKL